MRRTVAELAALLGVAAPTAGDAVVTGVAIDSRAVRAGDLFVALPGARADGHDFLAAAAGRGAVAALVCRSVAARLPQLVVDDTTAALQRIAAAVRREADWRLVGITGSVGKTTTKEFLAALMATSFAVGTTAGSRNSQAGFPAELCNQPPGIEWMVAELGMSRAGELDRLGPVARPDALLYTAVEPVHLEFFPSVDAIAEAKAELIPHLHRDGLLVLNAADPRVSAFARRFAGRTVRYGVAGESALWLESYAGRGLLGASFALTDGNMRLQVDWQLAGRHQAENLVAAACCALELGVPPRSISPAAAALHAARRRGEVHRLTSGVTVVDDSYNASPAATRRLLDLLAETSGRRLAVLGEMLELGEQTVAFHREVGERAAVAADVVVAVGGEPAREMAAAAGGRHVADAETAAGVVETLLAPGDIVLVKGSRGIGLDRVVDRLLAGEG